MALRRSLGEALSLLGERGRSLSTRAPVVQPGSAVPDKGILALNALHDCPGATQKAKRVGRGIGSGLGKTCGRGHKGQKARSGRGPGPLFEGGQTPVHQKVPRKGKHWTLPKHQKQTVALGELAAAIREGKLTPERTVCMRALKEAGLVDKKRARRNGVMILSSGSEKLKHSVHVEATSYEPAARRALEELGGSCQAVYYNDLGMRALMQPEKFPLGLPRPAWPPARLAPYYDRVGTLGGRGPRGSS